MGPSGETREEDGGEGPGDERILAAIVLAVVSALLFATLPLTTDDARPAVGRIEATAPPADATP
jgi:hypothetical protein